MATKLSAAEKKKLARLIKRCVDSGFKKTLVEEAGGEDEAHALAWDVVASDVTYVGDVELSFLLGRALTAERAAILAAHLARQMPPDDAPQYLPRWHPRVDALVYRALPLAPEAFAAASASYDDWAKLGLAFVRRRRGEDIPRDDRARIVTELARATARRQLFGYFTAAEPMCFVDAEGREGSLFLRTTADLRRLVEIVEPDGGARFDEALAETARENAWETIASVELALQAMPREVLVAQLATRWCTKPAQAGVYRMDDAHRYRMDEALALFEARLAQGKDTPAELFAGAREIARDVAEHGVERGDPMLLAMVLAIAAARRVDGDGDGDVDAIGELEAIVSFKRVAEHPALIHALVAALRPAAAARVHAWVESALETDGAAVLALAAHYDEALLNKTLSGAAPIVVEAFAALGRRALPALTRAMNAVPAERAARVRHAFVFVLAAAVAEGEEPPESLDLELLVAAFDGRPMEREPYGQELREATERIVNAMPRARRAQLLAAAYEAAPMSMVAMLHAIPDDAEMLEYLGTAIVDGMVTSWILRGLGARAVPALLAYGAQSKRASWVRGEAEQALTEAELAKVAPVFAGGEKWRAIEKDVAAANALHPDAQKVRVYLLERAAAATPAREGSRSRLGGQARGLPPAEVPKDGSGDELTHILTLDFEDAPELRTRYPQASAIALFSPSHESGESVEESVIVPLLQGKEDGRTRGGEALAVFGIEVPRDVFDDPNTLDTALRAVRDRIRGAGGHVLGRPFWIQGKPFSGDDGEGFVMQINDWLNDELNLADGSLYVYEDALLVQAL